MPSIVKLVLVAMLLAGGPAAALDPAPPAAVAYVEGTFRVKDPSPYTPTHCPQLFKGADKAVCRLPDALAAYVFAFCKKKTFDVAHLGTTTCVDFIARQLVNFETLVSGGVPTVHTYADTTAGVRCYKQPKKCVGFYQDLVTDILIEKNLFVRYIRDEEEKAVVAIKGGTPPADAVALHCSTAVYEAEGGEFLLELDNLGATEKGRAHAAFTAINNYMFPGAGQVRLILDMQGYLQATGRFLINDPDGVFTAVVADPNRPVKVYGDYDAIPACWVNFMSVLLAKTS